MTTQDNVNHPMTKWRVVARVCDDDRVYEMVDAYIVNTFDDYDQAADEARWINETTDCGCDFYVEEMDDPEDASMAKWRPVARVCVDDPVDDPVNRPDHYRLANGSEVIDVTENLNFNGGNAVKYIARSCRIDGVTKDDPLEDLLKAQFYIDRELARRRGGE